MKKNLIPDNPVLNILGFEPEIKAEKKQESYIKREESAKKTLKEPKMQELTPEKQETKSKRLNLLIKPSTAEKLYSLSEKYGISVNELINRLLESCVKQLG